MPAIRKIGPFRLDPEAEILFRGADPIPLGRRAVALLRALVERPGVPVSKEALLEAAWSGLAVEDSNLTVQIAALRRVLGEEPGGEGWIETMPRRGYRFVGPITADGEADVAEAAPARRAGATLAAEPVSARPGPAKVERRQLTVMSCELVVPASLGDQMDLEDLRDAVNAYHLWVAETAGRFTGYVAKRINTVALIYFGYPAAQEDDAEQALLAGLELCAGGGAFGRDTGRRWHCRVGIATGLVIVGDDTPEEHVLIGGAASLSGRLQTLASLGTLVIDRHTKRLTGDLFDCHRLGDVEAPGFAEPVEAWHVLGRGTPHSRFAAFHSVMASPLVGREDEMALLERRWDEAKGGEERVVLIAGEPGIGKSRMIAALTQRIEGEPCAQLYFSCLPRHQDSAFHPIIAQLERAAGFDRIDTPEEKFARLTDLLARNGTAAEDVVLLAGLLALPVAGSYPPVNLDPQRRKQRTIEALVGQVAEIAHRSPVVIVFEDVHWIDPSSLDVLSLAIRRLRTVPVLLLVTCRGDFEAPWLGQPGVTALSLSRLDRRDCAELARQVAGAQILSSTLLEQIVGRTDGVPLFVEELTKAVLEVAERPGGKTAAAAPLGASAVPATLQGLLLARLDRLGPAKQVAQIGAAIGREFSYELLAVVVPPGEQDLKASLDRLTESGLVLRQGAAPRASFVFKHALVQDTAYATLLRGPRQELHARIAQALESQFPEISEKQPEDLAHHFAEAGNAEKAIAYWRKAGARALSRSANLEAINHSRNGLELLPAIPAAQDRARLELELQLTLGQASIAAHGYTATETTRAFVRAEQFVESIGDTQQRYSALYGIFVGHLIGGRIKAAAETMGRMHQIALDGKDAAYLSLTYRLLGSLSFFRGSLSAASQELKKAVALFGPEPRRKLASDFGPDTGTAAQIFLAMTEWLRGRADTALATAKAAIATAYELDHALTLGQVLTLTAQLHYMSQNYDSMFEVSKESCDHCERTGIPYFGAIGRPFYIWAKAWRSNPGHYVAEFRQSLAAYEDMRSGLQVGLFQLMLAQLLLAAGAPAEAAREAKAALAKVEETGEHWWTPEFHRTIGDALLASADAKGAERCFRAAMVEARRSGALTLELRAAVRLAGLLSRQGDDTEARRMLAALIARFREGFATAELRDAKAILDGKP